MAFVIYWRSSLFKKVKGQTPTVVFILNFSNSKRPYGKRMNEVCQPQKKKTKILQRKLDPNVKMTETFTKNRSPLEGLKNSGQHFL